MKQSPIIFITGNEKKAEELKIHLNFPISHQKIDLLEMQSLDLQAIIAHKAKEAFAKIHRPVLVEDTSLTFIALNKLPGPLIKWFLESLGNEGLCRLLDTYPDRSALAHVTFGLYDGTNLQTFEGQMKGTIAKKPKGQKGFGWDPIFISEGYEKTWGEMSIEEQKLTSMRRIALKKLEKYLKN